MFNSFNMHGENKKSREKGHKGEDDKMDTVYAGGFNLETPNKAMPKETITTANLHTSPEHRLKLEFEFSTPI